MNFISDRIRELIPYTAGEQVSYIIKLNTNENPYPPTPNINKVLADMDIDKLKLYPDQNNTSLKQALSEKYNVSEDMVFVGNGSDEILALMYLAFFSDDDEKIAYPDITYSFYPVYNELFQVKSVVIPLKSDFTINLNQYKDLNVKGYIFANPNAPTGIAIAKDKLEEFIKTNQDKLVVVDEAYIDFCCESVADLTKVYNNLLVIKTFSKGYSLAGIRCGYAIGCKELVGGLKKIKDSFNNYPVDYITEKVAREAVLDVDYYKDINSKVIKTRDRVSEDMVNLGFNVLPSSSNFIFVTHKTHKAYDLYLKLKEEKILVRQWNKPKIDNYLRITIGTDHEMDILLDKLKEIING